MERLRVQLEVNGLSTVLISLDNYYRNRSERQIFTSDGEVDYESVDALDLNLLEVQLMSLLAGEPVRPLARFGFCQGRALFRCGADRLESGTAARHGRPARAESESIARRAGVSMPAYLHQRIDTTHRERPQPHLDDRHPSLWRLYAISVIAHMMLRIPWAMWSSVRKGEESYIFPFQNRWISSSTRRSSMKFPC